MNPVYSPVQPGAPYGNPKNMAYTGYPTAYPAAAPAYNPSLYPTNSPSYAPATLLMKQAWPQNSSSCGTEGTFHLPVDTGTENRTYQASSAAFNLESHIVCNYSSLTPVLEQFPSSTTSICKKRQRKCKGHFMHL
ncbi:protein FAM168A isoform X6 [Macaca fascicularis]|uniref:protein FAM168A isoform X6 n=1 Tax=Macaca fascicularis TaxID=9541 RepID=UPI003D1585AC